MLGSFILDIFLVAFYISMAMIVTGYFKIRDNTYELHRIQS